MIARIQTLFELSVSTAVNNGRPSPRVNGLRRSARKPVPSQPSRLDFSDCSERLLSVARWERVDLALTSLVPTVAIVPLLPPHRKPLSTQAFRRQPRSCCRNLRRRRDEELLTP